MSSALARRQSRHQARLQPAHSPPQRRAPPQRSFGTPDVTAAVYPLPTVRISVVSNDNKSNNEDPPPRVPKRAAVRNRQLLLDYESLALGKQHLDESYHSNNNTDDECVETEWQEHPSAPLTRQRQPQRYTLKQSPKQSKPSPKQQQQQMSAADHLWCGTTWTSPVPSLGRLSSGSSSSGTDTPPDQQQQQLQTEHSHTTPLLQPRMTTIVSGRHNQTETDDDDAFYETVARMQHANAAGQHRDVVLWKDETTTTDREEDFVPPVTRHHESRVTASSSLLSYSDTNSSVPIQLFSRRSISPTPNNSSSNEAAAPPSPRWISRAQRNQRAVDPDVWVTQGPHVTSVTETTTSHQPLQPRPTTTTQRRRRLVHVQTGLHYLYRQRNYAAAVHCFHAAIRSLRSHAATSRDESVALATALDGLGVATFYQTVTSSVDDDPAQDEEDKKTNLSIDSVLDLVDADNGSISSRMRTPLKAFHAALAIRMKELGRHHVDTVDTLQHMGTAFYHAGNYRGARRCYWQVWLVRRAICGPVDPAVAAAIRDVARAFRLGGRYDRARLYYNTALEMYEDKLGWSRESMSTVMGLVREMNQLPRLYGGHAGRVPSWEVLKSNSLNRSSSRSVGMSTRSTASTFSLSRSSSWRGGSSRMSSRDDGSSTGMIRSISFSQPTANIRLLDTMVTLPYRKSNA